MTQSINFTFLNDFGNLTLLNLHRKKLTPDKQTFFRSMLFKVQFDTVASSKFNSYKAVVFFGNLESFIFDCVKSAFAIRESLKSVLVIVAPLKDASLRSEYEKSTSVNLLFEKFAARLPPN